ncbi:MAG: trehalose-phosphatase [Candidatus Limnocylindria bacterium]
MSTDAALDHALALARPALSAPPAGLLTDLDGTLAPIVRDPAAVRLADGAAGALEVLAARLAVVGVVTGRAATDARRILGTPALLVIGNHGLEWLGPGAAEADVAPDVQRAAAALDGVIASVPNEPGVIVEHKGLSATVHYRNAPDPDTARVRVLAALEVAPRAGIDVRHGRMSVELRPAGLGDKGSALRDVVDRYALRGLLVMGDDVTDLDMFRAAANLRASGRLRAAIVGVAGEREVPAEVAAAADTTMPDVAALVRLLEHLGKG